MLLARLTAVVSSVLSLLTNVPAARSWSIAITPTPMMTVTIIASMRVNARRLKRRTGRVGMDRRWVTIVDIAFVRRVVKSRLSCDYRRPAAPAEAVLHLTTPKRFVSRPLIGRWGGAACNACNDREPRLVRRGSRLHFVVGPAYFTRLLSLKIGRMIDIAMKPTRPPITTIISGSIIAVTLLMTLLSSRA